MYKRAIYPILQKRLSEKRRFIQVLAGPRQTGKTTLAQQILKSGTIQGIYASADGPTLQPHSWIEQQWEFGRLEAKKGSTVLILDEIQKIDNWSETVKKLWDNDSLNNIPLYCIILGSSPLLMQKGLSESLTGRFEVIPVTHWSFQEMQNAFDISLEQYIYYGGYPGAAELIAEPDRWQNYILHSLIEPTISKDILLMTRVDKPALLRRLFELGCQYSGQILSFQKMLGQLKDAGNTTTLANYLELLGQAGLLTGLSKYAGQKVRQRASSPKLQVLNTALMAALGNTRFEDTLNNNQLWGRFVESAIGSHLANSSRSTQIKVFYWSSRNREVDFVLEKGDKLVAIEVKSHNKPAFLPGMDAFSNEFPVTKKLLVGGNGIPVAEFLTTPVTDWF